MAHILTTRSYRIKPPPTFEMHTGICSLQWALSLFSIARHIHLNTLKGCCSCVSVTSISWPFFSAVTWCTYFSIEMCTVRVPNLAVSLLTGSVKPEFKVKLPPRQDSAAGSVSVSSAGKVRSRHCLSPLDGKPFATLDICIWSFSHILSWSKSWLRQVRLRYDMLF